MPIILCLTSCIIYKENYISRKIIKTATLLVFLFCAINSDLEVIAAQPREPSEKMIIFVTTQDIFESNETCILDECKIVTAVYILRQIVVQCT